MKLIIGLGNPGLEYEWTRHNIGFNFLDYYCKIKNINLKIEKFNGLFTRIKLNNKDVLIAKPLTYMNLSGQFVRKIMDFYKISISNIIVIYDDLSLNCGEIKFREKGSAGGHNGIKNLIFNLGNEFFKRIKIGIGPLKGEIKKFVLSKFSLEEKNKIISNFEKISKILDYFIEDDIQKGLSIINGKKS